MNKPTTSAIAKAVEVTSVVQIAKACGVTVQAVYKWIAKGYPPTDRCEAIERAVNGRVSRFDLLPPTFTKAVQKRPARKSPTVANLK